MILDLATEKAERAVRMLEAFATAYGQPTTQDLEELKRLLGDDMHDILLQELYQTQRTRHPQVFSLLAKVLRVVYLT